MRITERRLRKIIRQVIREGFGDGDMTSASDTQRNRRIEKQSQHDSPIMQRQRAGQERKSREALEEMRQALKSQEVQRALTSKEPMEVSGEDGDYQPSGPLEIMLNGEYTPSIAVMNNIIDDIRDVFEQFGVAKACCNINDVDMHDTCTDELHEIIMAACETLKRSTGGRYDSVDYGHGKVRLRDSDVCWSSNGGDTLVWNPKILFPAIARAC